MRRRAIGLLAAAAVVLSACSGGSGASGRFSFVSPGGQTELTYPAGERGAIGNLSGPDLTGDGSIALDDFRGKVVVLNVWGSWCGPCRGEADALNTAAEVTADRGVQFLGINVKDSRDAGADFHAAKLVPYPSIYDPSMRTLLAIDGYPTSSIPSTVVLDRDHRVAKIFLRVVTTGELVRVTSDLAAEGEALSPSPGGGG